MYLSVTSFLLFTFHYLTSPYMSFYSFFYLFIYLFTKKGNTRTFVFCISFICSFAKWTFCIIPVALFNVQIYLSLYKCVCPLCISEINPLLLFSSFHVCVIPSFVNFVLLTNGFVAEEAASVNKTIFVRWWIFSNCTLFDFLKQHGASRTYFKFHTECHSWNEELHSILDRFVKESISFFGSNFFASHRNSLHLFIDRFVQNTSSNSWTPKWLWLRAPSSIGPFLLFLRPQNLKFSFHTCIKRSYFKF